MSKKAAADSLWSFSLRSYNATDDCYSSDTDSENNNVPAQNSEAAGKSDPTSEEARLLEELDIGSRNDTASYKPNPWSIAKANAATRPPKPDHPTKRKIDTSRTSKAPQKSVMDLLRQQSKNPTQKVTARPVVAAQPAPLPNDVCPPMIPCQVSESLPADDAHIPSDDTLVDPASIDAPCFLKLKDVSLPDIIPPPSRPRSPRMPPRSDDADLPLPSSNLAASLTRGTPLVLSQQEPWTSAAMKVSPRLAPSDLPHIPSPASSLNLQRQPAQDHLDAPLGRDLRTMLFKPQLSNHSSGSPSAPSSHSVVVSSATSRARMSRPGPSTVREFTPIPRPPPFKRERSSPSLHSPPLQHRAYYGSPYHPSVHPQSSPIPRRAHTPVPEASPYDGCRASHPASSPIPSASLTRERLIKPEPYYSPEPRSTFSRFAFHPASPPCRPTEVSNGLRVHQASRVSARNRVRSPSISPRPSPRPHRRPKRDAYEAFSSPEANWSTIPAKRGRIDVPAKAGRSRVAATKPFKMPVTLGSALRGRGGTAERSSAKARVTTYLPPPPKSRPRADPASPTGGPSLSPFAYRPPCSPVKRTDESRPIMPSPPSFQPMTIRRAPPQPTSLSSYRCSTPAREFHSQHQPPVVHSSHACASSDTLSSNGWPYDESEDNGEATMSFDTPSLARRYLDVRRGVAERKLLSAETWEILDLPSCGVVFRDEWRSQGAAGGEGGKQKAEIVIVAWP